MIFRMGFSLVFFVGSVALLLHRPLLETDWSQVAQNFMLPFYPLFYLADAEKFYDRWPRWPGHFLGAPQFLFDIVALLFGLFSAFGVVAFLLSIGWSLAARIAMWRWPAAAGDDGEMHISIVEGSDFPRMKYVVKWNGGPHEVLERVVSEESPPPEGWELESAWCTGGAISGIWEVTAIFRAQVRDWQI